jgi:Domain of unknown function (DUF1992)
MARGAPDKIGTGRRGRPIMTTRKPADMSFPDWIERQIRDAEAQGAFENLPGAGKPIPHLGRPQNDMDWIVSKLRSEDVDIVSVLPPALALAKEVELLPQRLRALSSEARVRGVVDDLNARIRHALLQPQVGPPMRVRPVDVEQAVGAWQADREAAARSAPMRPTPAPAPVPPRRRWFRRRER